MLEVEKDMLPGFLIGLREGLEAALIVGITLGILTQMDQKRYRRVVFAGVIAALILSLVAAVILRELGASLEGAAEEIFEGAMMLLAAGVLTWMILWMQRQSREYQSGLESGVRQALLRGQLWALFGIAFFAVLREGIETTLFLTATALVAEEREVFLGALLGLISAILIGWAIFTATVQLNLRRFFQVTSILLILFAAGLLAHGVHEFVEVGWLPSIIDPIYNLNSILDEDSLIGSMLKALFGYNGNPSLTESLAYVGYLVVIILTLRWTARQSMKSSKAA
ncbi:MAG: iron permease [Anaerolineales bacterium]|nr:iron permease [Anaerolineales bacterium]